MPWQLSIHFLVYYKGPQIGYWHSSQAIAVQQESLLVLLPIPAQNSANEPQYLCRFAFCLFICWRLSTHPIDLTLLWAQLISHITQESFVWANKNPWQRKMNSSDENTSQVMQIIVQTLTEIIMYAYSRQENNVECRWLLTVQHTYWKTHCKWCREVGNQQAITIACAKERYFITSREFLKAKVAIHCLQIQILYRQSWAVRWTPDLRNSPHTGLQH